jgi:serine protease
MTADPREIGILDRGEIAGWTRTGRTFNAYPPASAQGSLVCRFYGAAFARSSHFYTALANECALLRNDPNWQFEGEVFRVALPNAADGHCAAATIPLYRLYNNNEGGAPNHRYTVDLEIRSAMIAEGWIPEGYGALGVNACVPG